MLNPMKCYRSGPALAIALVAVFACSTAIFAQDNSKQPQTQQQSQSGQQNQAGTITPAIPQQTTPATTQSQAQAPKVDPAEEAAYKAFAAMPKDTTDAVNKQIQAGKDFLTKYPKSGYSVVVYNALVNDYYFDAQHDQSNTQDLNNLYAATDKAVALDPDDLDALVLTGWVIPHFYDRNDLDANQKLDKAEKYERHALELIPTLPKPANLSDQEFAAEKSAAALQAHSGLGLTLVRKGDYAGSAAELKQAVNVPQPDPADLYVLGIDLAQLKQYSDAADAFQKCSTAAGSLQVKCQQSADQMKKAAQAAHPAPAAGSHN